MRKRIGIAIDYTIRIPNFIENYAALKKEIVEGAFADKVTQEDAELMEGADVSIDPEELKKQNEIDKSSYDYHMATDRELDQRNFWHELNETDPKAAKFYKEIEVPKANFDDEFDLTYKDYFYNVDHRFRFLQEYSYNLFGRGSVTNKADIELINTAQSKLFDVILIDRAPYGRKVGHTFAFLSRARLYIKGVEFVTSNEQYEQIKQQCVDVWDPKINREQAIGYSSQVNQPTEKFLNWLMGLEEKCKQ